MRKNNIQIHNLICHRDVDIAMKCLMSLLKNSSDPIELVLHDDGSLTVEDLEAIRKHLGEIKIIKRNVADLKMDELLKNYPTCRKFRYQNIMALKILDVPLLSDSDFGYSDSDILYLKPFRNLFSFPDENVSAVFMYDIQEAYSLYPWNMLLDKNVKYKSRINAGLYYFRKTSFDLDYLEWILKKTKFRPISIWMEQTCWAALAYKAGCHHWDKSQVVMVSKKEDITQDTVAAHFGGSIRNLLESYLFLNMETGNSSDEIDINSEIAKDCTAFRLTLDRIKVRIRRSIN